MSALTYSAHEPNGAVVIWSSSEAIADLTDCGDDFDKKVLRAKCICEATSLRVEWLEAGRA